VASGALQEPQGLFVMRSDELTGVLEALGRDYVVVAPVKNVHDHVFSIIEDLELVDLHYQSTILPPKKVLHQPFEVLFAFHEEKGISLLNGIKPQILLGVHPCDVYAIRILDAVYTRDYPDPYYVKKRENTLIFALNCTTVGENCFCLSMGTGPDVREPVDAVFTDIGDQYLVEAYTEKGYDIAKKVNLPPAPAKAIAGKKDALARARRHFKKRMTTEKVGELLEDNFRHPLWEELMEDCLGCGSCTMVCPTCFCYNVIDKLDLDLKSGKRQREWDSCMLLEYAQVALGHNFRRDRDARIKQRVYHKLAYYEPQFGTLGCVGCGRCIATCVKHIDITDIVARLRGE